MKIAIASDIHGSYPAAEAFFYMAEKMGAERFVLLGDLYYHGVRNELPEGYAPMKVAELLNARKESIIAVRGNCDSDVDRTVSDFEMQTSALLFIGGKTVFCTHGDHYDKDHLPCGKYDVMLYGHYHTGFIEKKGDMIFANPGSVSLPKGGTEKSFLLLDEGSLTLVSLTGREIARLAL